MPTDKPICGPTGLGSGGVFEGESTLGVILAVFGIAGTIQSVITFFGGASIALGSFVGGMAVFGIVAVFHYMRCSRKVKGPVVCTSGIINRIVPSFSSAWDDVFPFTAMHTRVDVVVNPKYWPEVEDGAGYIVCADDSDRSPILSGFYKDDAVCAATFGATIGAGVGALVGIGIALAVSLSCGPLAWLCAIIALLVVAIIALVGAIVGGHIGKTQSEGRALPPHPDLIDPINVGDYVAQTGTLVVDADYDFAKVYWFVDVTKQMGKSYNSPPFSYEEASNIWGCNLPIVVL